MFYPRETIIWDEAIGFADANIAGATVLKLKRENPDPARTTIVDDNEMKRDLGDLNPLIGMIDDLDFKKTELEFSLHDQILFYFDGISESLAQGGYVRKRFTDGDSK